MSPKCFKNACRGTRIVTYWNIPVSMFIYMNNQQVVGRNIFVFIFQLFTHTLVS